jgi:hypothetical protein
MSLDGVTQPNGGLPCGMVMGPACQVCKGAGSVGIRNAQISLMLKLRKDRRTKILLLLKLGIKVCRIITESYRHLILYKRR